MALSVDYIYKFILDLMKKNQAGGLKSTAFELQWNDAQGSYQDDLLGRWQLRNSGKTGLNTGLIEDETILQKLSPFIKPYSVTVTNGNGDKPDDFVFRLAMRINGKDVYKINYNQIASVNDSVIDPPSTTTDTYYFVEYENYYYYLPRTGISAADLDYVCMPTDIKWGYTFAANGMQVYSSGSSIQPQWDSSSCREITKRMLTNLGVSFKDADFMSFGKSVQLTGE